MILRKIGYSMGKLQAKSPWLFVALALLITLAALPGIPLLLSNVEPSLEKVLPQDLDEVKVMNDMRTTYGADMLYIVLSSDQDMLDRQTLIYIDTLTQALRDVQNVRQVMSVTDVIKQSSGQIPFERRDIIDAARTAQLYINQDRDLSVVMIRADTGANAEQVEAVLSDIRFTIDALEDKNPGLRVELTGFGAIDQATFKVIISDFSKITIISFLLMIAYLLFHYRFDLKKTVYSMVIMMLSLIWALGVTGYLGIELNVVTMVAAAMIMALGSSYGINSVYHFYDDFLLQYPRKEAIAKFQEFLIVGLTGSALAEIAGFLALLFGLMPSMRALGIILAIGIFFALFASVVILPAFFFLLEKDAKIKGARY